MDQSTTYQNSKKDESLFNERSFETAAHVTAATIAMIDEDRNDVYVPPIEVNSTKINVFNNHIYILKVLTSPYSCAICIEIMNGVYESQGNLIVKFQLSKERN